MTFEHVMTLDRVMTIERVMTLKKVTALARLHLKQTYDLRLITFGFAPDCSRGPCPQQDYTLEKYDLRLCFWNVVWPFASTPWENICPYKQS